MQQGRKELYVGCSLSFILGRGLAYLRAKDYPEAIEEFLAARQTVSTALEPWLLLGKAYDLDGRTEMAERTFEELYMRAAAQDEAALWIAGAYTSAGNIMKALDWARRVDLAPIRHRLLAVLPLFLDRYEESIDALNTLIVADPGDSLASTALAFALWKKQQESGTSIPDRGEEVIAKLHRHAKRAVELDPTNVTAHSLLALALEHQGKRDEADRHLDAALGRGSEDLAAHFATGIILGGRGRYKEASLHLAEAVRLAENRALPREAGLLRSALGGVLANDTDGAVDDMFLERYRPDLLFGMGVRLAKQGRYEKAVKLLQEAVAERPHALVYWRLAGVLSNQGRLDEALAAIEKAIEGDRNEPYYWYARGLICEKQEDLEEAARAYSRSLYLNLERREVQRRLVDVLIRQQPPLHLTPLDELIASLGPATDSLEPRLVAVLALAELFSRNHGDTNTALALAQHAVEGDPRDTHILAAAAKVEYESGNLHQAIGLLEAAVRRPQARLTYQDVLIAYREEIAPTVVSYASVDAALDSWEPTSGRDAWLLESNLSQQPNREADNPIVYVQGRLFQRAGQFDRAVHEFRTLTAVDPSRPEPHLRLVESLWSAGSPEAAVQHLKGILAGGEVADRRLWNLWLILCLDGLGQSPDAALVGAPLEGARPVTGSDYAADMPWLLEQLRAGAVRINCGGQEHVSSKAVWGCDRFYTMGKTGDHPTDSAIAGTPDSPLYQSYRVFSRHELQGGYQIPLPRGRYRVMLHFAEIRFQAPGVRRFHVQLEGRQVLHNYEPLEAGFLTADTRHFDLMVNDGILDIDFVPVARDPKISAIEITTLQ
jgi:tetratricopeptide (TPR) repeat protein